MLSGGLQWDVKGFPQSLVLLEFTSRAQLSLAAAEACPQAVWGWAQLVEQKNMPWGHV